MVKKYFLPTHYKVLYHSVDRLSMQELKIALAVGMQSPVYLRMLNRLDYLKIADGKAKKEKVDA